MLLLVTHLRPPHINDLNLAHTFNRWKWPNPAKRKLRTAASVAFFLFLTAVTIGGGAGGGGAAITTGAPQLGQKAAPGGSSLPHFEQKGNVSSIESDACKSVQGPCQYTILRRFPMRRLQITLEDELYASLTKEIKELRFGSYSHAINYALKRLREELEKEKRKT